MFGVEKMNSFYWEWNSLGKVIPMRMITPSVKRVYMVRILANYFLGCHHCAIIIIKSLSRAALDFFLRRTEMQ
jgi:hypothetical protein